MPRGIAVIGAATNIGIRPYDDGTPRSLERAPNAIREQGLTARLGARDAGDVAAAPYRDFVRPPGRPRNEDAVIDYSRRLAAHVAEAHARGDFIVLLGGDCSVVLGGLLGVARHGRVGLVYLDAHADFATPSESRTGSVASMCLAFAVGRGGSALARLRDDVPLVRGADVALIGRRDHAESPIYGQDQLASHAILDLPHAHVRARGAAAVARTALEHVTRDGIDGFWIHLDADLLDPSVIPAVDSPEPNGLTLDEVSDLLRPLVTQPTALGMELTIYDPQLDPERISAARLATLLVTVLRRGNEK